MIDAALQAIVEREAKRAELTPAWILGIITVESGGETGAWNPEPKYRYFWDLRTNAPFRKPTEAELASEIPPKDFAAPRGIDADAEWWAQQASWGLMQVMGAVARERGFTGRHIPDLCVKPELNLLVGCRHLRALLRRHGGKLDLAVASYNAGSPRLDEPRVRDYVTKVMTAIDDVA